MKALRSRRESRGINIILSPATAQHRRQTKASMLAPPDRRLLVRVARQP
jgi:hypothetical protein